MCIADLFSAFKKLESCSTEGTNNAASFIFAPPQMIAEDGCRTACEKIPVCDFYIFQMNLCYFGNFEDKNPIPKPAFLLDEVDVYLKDPSKANNAALKSCKM